ncbi:hypothetical protein UNDYM_6010 (plasmid) [Undibacterium sp. YM2]|nr:hypothetical protein UNDYM_6010 [Undibacterium sp. YM2]
MLEIQFIVIDVARLGNRGTDLITLLDGKTGLAVITNIDGAVSYRIIAIVDTRENKQVIAIFRQGESGRCITTVILGPVDQGFSLRIEDFPTLAVAAIGQATGVYQEFLPGTAMQAHCGRLITLLDCHGQGAVKCHFGQGGKECGGNTDTAWCILVRCNLQTIVACLQQVSTLLHDSSAITCCKNSGCDIASLQAEIIGTTADIKPDHGCFAQTEAVILPVCGYVQGSRQYTAQ